MQIQTPLNNCAECYFVYLKVVRNILGVVATIDTSMSLVFREDQIAKVDIINFIQGVVMNLLGVEKFHLNLTHLIENMKLNTYFWKAD